MFDRMGRQFGGADMPMTSYSGNNALSGMAAAQMGQMPGVQTSTMDVGRLGPNGFGKKMVQPGMTKPYLPNTGGWAPPNFGGGASPYAPQLAPGMQPPMQPGTPPIDPNMQPQSALAGMGGAAPMVFNAQGLPQQFQDFRQQMQDWRGLRPDRPDWGAMRGQEGFDPRQARQDWRGQMQDWRGQRPQFAGWR